MDQNKFFTPDNEQPHGLFILPDERMGRVVNSAGLVEYSDGSAGYFGGFWHPGDRNSISSFLQNLSDDGCVLLDGGRVYSDGVIKYRNGTTATFGIVQNHAGGNHAFAPSKPPPNKLPNQEASITGTPSSQEPEQQTNPTNTGAGTVTPMQPLPAPTLPTLGPPFPVPVFAGRGGFANRGRSTSQGFRPSQVTPLATSPRFPNHPNASGTFSPSAMGIPKGPSSLLYGYPTGLRRVSNPSPPTGPRGSMRNRADYVRGGGRLPGAQRQSALVTNDERARLFDGVGHRRGVSPQPLSPLNPDFDHNANQTTDLTGVKAAKNVPGPLGQSVVGQYTSHGNEPNRHASSPTVVRLPSYQQAIAVIPELQPSLNGSSSSFNDESKYHTRQPQTSCNPQPSLPTSGNQQNQHQQQQQQQQQLSNAPSPSHQQHQQHQKPTPHFEINGLDNDNDAFKDDCSIHLPEPCDCGPKFPDCKWPFPCPCPRKDCSPRPAPDPTVNPTISPASPSLRETGSTQVPEGGYFVIPGREGREIAIMSPGGERVVYKQGGGDGNGDGEGA